MTQPKYAPIGIADEVRPSAKLSLPGSWRPDRPSEHRPGSHPTGRGLGTPGPDQGYALLLAEELKSEAQPGEGEHAEDLLGAAVIIGLKRAALFGRAPVRADLELGLALLGALAPASPELLAERRGALGGLSHDYWRQRELADLVGEEELRTPASRVREAAPLFGRAPASP